MGGDGAVAGLAATVGGYGVAAAAAGGAATAGAYGLAVSPADGWLVVTQPIYWLCGLLLGLFVGVFVRLAAGPPRPPPPR